MLWRLPGYAVLLVWQAPAEWERATGFDVTQAVRNLDDLECLACPPKYRALNTFWKYYTGQATAPYPTLFSETQRRVHLFRHLW